ncbi:hypothetical protein TRSC58_01877 [Trypanosoma rangeli SC58]|uniref:Uncharacterized protein n=1 Tax=Trypanosoma rangeli SC58 TaxID=429131 RepID=A0A061JAS5_TRYRA|nr:hypothetical protein TRSC58_01877 [Trypanosoma rangeli SC58]
MFCFLSSAAPFYFDVSFFLSFFFGLPRSFPQVLSITCTFELPVFFCLRFFFLFLLCVRVRQGPGRSGVDKMSMFGAREVPDDTFSSDITNISANYLNENNCQRFWQRLMTCVRESQELDVLYDCRSRMIDLRECVTRHKQTTWVFRETMATLRNEEKFRRWLKDYDESFGHPPLLEAVEKVRSKLEQEGGVGVLNPTVFHDPDVFIPREKV